MGLISSNNNAAACDGKPEIQIWDYTRPKLGSLSEALPHLK